MTRWDMLKRLNAITQSGMPLCSRAYEYAEGDEVTADAYLRAKGLAVKSHCSVDQRVEGFRQSAIEQIQRFDEQHPEYDKEKNNE